MGWDGILAPVVDPGPPKLPFRVIDPILKPILQFVFPPGPLILGTILDNFLVFFGLLSRRCFGERIWKPSGPRF